ncbi:MAG TPA: hypothetical protein PKE62_03650 [Anaerolineales bacterium]|nr:hypothetical protein [Anaerolineales bacterium]
MSNKTKSPTQDLMNDVIKNSLMLIIGFIFSTALIGGAGYLLFETQSEVEEINRLELEIKNGTAEAKSYFDMASVVSSGYISDEQKSTQIVEIINFLVIVKSVPQLDPQYVSDTTKILNSTSLQLIQEKGKISGFSLEDEKFINRQKTLMAWYDNEIILYDETYKLIVNWEKESESSKDEKILQLIDSMGKAIELANAVISQGDQIVYYVENVKLAEVDRIEAEYQGKKSQLQLRRIASWVGVVVGLLLLVSLAVYTRKTFFVKDKNGKKQKAG